MTTENFYLPIKAAIRSAKELSKDVKLFSLVVPGAFAYRPGQFVMVSAWGSGEVPISITSTPEVSEGVEVCVRAVGHATSAINRLGVGDTLWLRGPYGRPFPLNRETKDILIISGGIGIVPLRPLINQILANAASQQTMADAALRNNVNIIYGSRNPSEVLFPEEVASWMDRGANVILTVDTCDINNWKGCTGLVTEHLGKARVDFKNCTAYICGPPIMIQATMRDLSLMGMPDDRIITTLEAHMKCGVGKCGHCYCGGKLICTDGPVFSLEEIKQHRIKPGVDSLA